MALTTTKHWRWDAPGAHTLTGEVGSARNLLRDFLEDCGWSVSWEDAGAQKVVLRNSQAHGGSGGYLRIVDDGSVPTLGARAFQTWFYEDMTDIDTGTGACQVTAGVWVKSITADSTPRPYFLAADQRTFHCNIFTHDPPNIGTYFVEHVAGSCGDLDPAIPGDHGCYAAWPRWAFANNSASIIGALSPYNKATEPDARFFTARNSSLLADPTSIGCVVKPLTNSVQPNLGLGGSSFVAAYPAAGYVDGTFSCPYIAGEVNGAVRGALRGLRIPTAFIPGNVAANWGVFSELGSGRDFVLLRANTTAAVGPVFDCALLIDTTGPW